MNEHDWRKEMDRQRSAIDAAIENLIQQDMDKLNAYEADAADINHDYTWSFLFDIMRWGH